MMILEDGLGHLFAILFSALVIAVSYSLASELFAIRLSLDSRPWGRSRVVGAAIVP